MTNPGNPCTYALFLGLLLAWCGSCGRAEPAAGLYYWRTDYTLAAADYDTLAALGFGRLNVRVFDLDWDFRRERAVPVGSLRLPDSLHQRPRQLITPTVFITNRVWLHERDPVALADRFIAALDRFTAGHGWLNEHQSLQIDCDWTARTQVPYFEFLSRVKSLRAGWTVSATVRLHQYRDRAAAGVPPVDRALLMCYNVAPVGEPATRDAIYDEALLRGYLRGGPYPIPLDAALPLFRWGAAFRGDRFLGLVDPVGATANYVTATGGNRAVVTTEHETNGVFLRPGDLIRTDGLKDARALTAARALLRERIEPAAVFYYDFQSFEQLIWYFGPRPQH